MYVSQLGITVLRDAADGADNMQNQWKGTQLESEWGEERATNSRVPCKIKSQQQQRQLADKVGWKEQDLGRGRKAEGGGRICTKRMKYENSRAKGLPTCGAFCCCCCWCPACRSVPVCYCTFACRKRTKVEGE